MEGFIVGLVAGVGSSFCWWLITQKVIIPKLTFSDEISKENRTEKIPTYKFTIYNNSLRAVFDIEIF